MKKETEEGMSIGVIQRVINNSCQICFQMQIMFWKSLYSKLMK
jgi:hypothetical protein